MHGEFDRLLQKSVRCFAVTAMVLTFCGVGGCGDSRKLVPVSGSVTVDGEPAVGATLLFHPESDPAGVTASGTVRDDGTFTLVSGMDKGLTAGKYIVTVSWPDPSVKPTEAQMMMGMAEPGPDLLKGRYATKQGSGLSVEIAADTQQLPPFELEKP